MSKSFKGLLLVSVDTGTMLPERAKQHMDGIKDDLIKGLLAAGIDLSVVICSGQTEIGLVTNDESIRSETVLTRMEW